MSCKEDMIAERRHSALKSMWCVWWEGGIALCREIRVQTVNAGLWAELPDDARADVAVQMSSVT